MFSVALNRYIRDAVDEARPSSLVAARSNGLDEKIYNTLCLMIFSIKTLLHLQILLTSDLIDRFCFLENTTNINNETSLSLLALVFELPNCADHCVESQASFNNITNNNPIKHLSILGVLVFLSFDLNIYTLASIDLTLGPGK